MATKQLPVASDPASHPPEDIEMSSFPKEDWKTKQDECSLLVETYWDIAHSIAFRMLHRPEDAEDAVQDAFMSAYRAFPSFKGQSKASTWLYRVVVNACLMNIRKGKTRSKYLNETYLNDAVVFDWRYDPVRASLNNELHDTLGSGLWQLAPHLRAAVVLRDVEGFSNQRAAETLQISLCSLKSRVHRGHVFLRKYLKEYLTNPHE